MPQGLGFREFARREGCSDTLVRKAVKGGYLKTFPDGSLDPQLVGSPWRAGNRREPAANPVRTEVRTEPQKLAPAKLPSIAAVQDGETTEEAAERLIAEAGAPLSMAEAERVKENYLALLRKLEFETKSNSSISLVAAETAFFNAGREGRDAWMSWAPRIATEAAAELGVDARKLTEVLTRHVQQHLAELGIPEFDLGGTA